MKNTKKWQVGWGITKKCNMECEFCYSSNAREGSDNLKLEVLTDFVDKNHNYIEAINYGTGENTLVLDWFELINHIRINYPQIEQALTTNGHLAEKVYSNKDLYKIVKRSIDEIDISLDYARPSKHNFIRGNKKAYQNAIKTLKFCKEVGIKSTIVFLGIEKTLIRSNLENLFDIASKYGALIRLNIYRPVTEVININPPSSTVIYDALNWIVKNYNVEVLSDPLFSAVFYDKGTIKDQSGSNSLRILPDGSITPSTYLVTENWKGGNIKDFNSLKNIEKSNQFQEMKEEYIPDDCVDCNLKERCKGGAKDRRILFYETLNNSDPYCPFNNNINIDDLIIIQRDNTDRVTIHDGYLPTLIFSP